MVQREEKRFRGSEPSGEAETLKGRISKEQMGSRAGREKPPKAAPLSRPKRATPVNPREPEPAQAFSVKIAESLFYRPKTKDNRTLYELLLSKIN